MKQPTENCPLCQQLNACAVTSGANINDCWCNKQPYLTTEGLTKVLTEEMLAALDGKACICESCLSSIKAELAVEHALYKQVD